MFSTTYPPSLHHHNGFMTTGVFGNTYVRLDFTHIWHSRIPKILNLPLQKRA